MFIRLFSSLNQRTIKFLIGVFVLMSASGVLSGTNSMAQDEKLKLKSVPNGFSGEYDSSDARLLVDSHSPADDYTLSRIRTPDKRILAESIRNKDVVMVTLSDVTLTFHLDKKSRAEKKSAKLPTPDEEKLERFALSEESAAVRKLIAELIVQRASADPSSIKGFVVIAMVLGDGPGTPNNLQARASCDRPRLVQMYASYRSDTRPSNEPLRNHKLVTASSTGSSVVNCMGCCGPSCWGCTSCWTGACLQHDWCVSQNGYWACNYLLDDAIASMYFLC